MATRTVVARSLTLTRTPTPTLTLTRFVTFILPIILDGIFQSLAPRLFELNTIALLQV